MKDEVEVLEDKPSKNQNNKKKGKGSVVVIVLLILVILGLAAYIAYDKGWILSDKKESKTSEKNNKKESSSKEEQKQIVYDVTDEKISNLISNLTVGFGCNNVEEFVTDKKITNKDVSTLRAYHIAEKNEFFKSGKNSISLEEYTTAVKKYLGKDYEVNPEEIDYNGQSCPQYKYNNSTNTFEKQETACGGICGPLRTKYKIVKAVDTNGTLELTLKVLFNSKDGGINYYSDYARTKLIDENKLYYDIDNGEKIAILDVDSNYNLGGIYKFIFELQDGNYTFKSSEPTSE